MLTGNPLSLTSSRRAFLGGTAATAGALILGITIAFPRMKALADRLKNSR